MRPAIHPTLLAALLATASTTFSLPACGQNVGGGPQSFRGRDLTDHSFSGQDLSGADFRGATLDGAQFLGSRLDGARFDGTHLGPSSKGPVRFSGASLRKTMFPKATFDRVDLQYADISCADFSGTDLTTSLLGPMPRIDETYARTHACRTSFAGGALRLRQLPLPLWKVADLSHATVAGLNASSVSFRGADLSDIKFEGAPLAGFDLRQAHLVGADLRHADLRGAKLEGATLYGAHFDRARLTYARMIGVDAYDAKSDRAVVLTGADLQHAVLDGADLRKANLAETNLSGASLRCSGSGEGRRCVDLTRAILQQGSGEGATAIGATLVGADLTSAVLNGVDFQDTSLVDAKLERVTAAGTKFTAATLTGAVFDHATLAGVDFFLAGLENASFSSARLLKEGDEPVDFSCSQLGGANFENATVEGTRFPNAVLPPQDQCCKQVSDSYYCGTAIASESAYGPTVRPKLTGPVLCPNGATAQCTGDQWLVADWKTTECNADRTEQTIWQRPDCSGGHHGKVVHIPDPKLKKCLQDQLLGGRDVPITQELADGVFQIVCPGLGIEDLAGLGAFSHLQHLDLSDNEVADTRPIEDLGDLEVLRLANNRVRELDVSGFASLGVLDLSGIPLTTLTGMAEVYLSSIDVSRTHLARCDEVGLYSQTTLFYADLSGNECKGVGDLSSLDSLTYLFLEKNQLQELNGLGALACPLKGETSLAAVSLACNPLLDCARVDFGSCSDGADLRSRSACGQNDLPECREEAQPGGGTLACIPPEVKPSRLVYVAPGGRDGRSCGASADQACATMRQGIAQCKGHADCAVVTAWGDYAIDGTLQLTAGVGLFGGCLFGAPVPAVDAQGLYSRLMGGPAAQPVVSARTIRSDTLFHGFQAWSTTPQSAGAASLALAAEDSPGLRILEVQLLAGVGQVGATGAVGTKGAAGGDGKSVAGRNDAGGAAGTVPACPDTSGGSGAEPAKLYWSDCSDSSCDCPFLGCGCVGYEVNGGSSGSPGETGRRAGGGGGQEAKVYGYCPAVPLPAVGGVGEGGGHGPCGAGGKRGSDRFGSFQNGIWTPGKGLSGLRGGHAGGGGGGGAGGACDVPCGTKICPGNFLFGQAGGGGGAGGCGAGGGQGGGTGGASIPLVVTGEAPAFSSVALIPTRGGTGGTGGAGVGGGAGGRGGASYSAQTCDGFDPGSSTGAAGGRGGSGGIGGASGGGGAGNGGPAIGLALIKASVDLHQLAIYPGRGGAPGKGGKGGEPSGQLCHGTEGEEGIEGVVADSHDFTHAKPADIDESRDPPYPEPPPEPEPDVSTGVAFEEKRNGS